MVDIRTKWFGEDQAPETLGMKSGNNNFSKYFKKAYRSGCGCRYSWHSPISISVGGAARIFSRENSTGGCQCFYYGGLHP